MSILASENELVALIPVRDKRLRPRRTYVHDVNNKYI